MSIDLVNSEISKFLLSNMPEVLCIRGKWGVGKTYNWTKRLGEAQQADRVGLPRYSYVSLFGINSLEELKLAIFENVIMLSKGNLRADLATLDEFVNSKVGPWRKLTRLVQSVSYVKSFIGVDATTILSFLTIRDQIICFDDLERRGQRLDIGDVLGLVSFLREQRNCKVSLILNDEALINEAKTKFETYLEKVVDVSLVYEPTAFDSIGVALGGSDPVSQRVADLCTDLGISNIRVIKRIERVVRAIQPMLANYDEEVFRQATLSLVLFCWSHDQPGEAPTLEFLTTKKAKRVYGLQKNENLPDNEAAWNALLESYGFRWADDFDVVLIKGVRNGFFDPAEIDKHARELHEKAIATKADGSFEDAWRLYHDSFADNQDQVLDAIYASFMKNYRYITPLNLNGTVTLFKKLGRLDQAHEIIKQYVENRAEGRRFFDLEHYAFSSDITDPDIKKAFNEKCAKLKYKRDVPAMLLALKEGLSDEVLSELAAAPVDEYRRAFQKTTGRELRKMLSEALQFDRIINASPEMKEISKRAREALKIIGTESPINACRVANFGVIVDETTTPDTSSVD
jgi:hypothetical protein